MDDMYDQAYNAPIGYAPNQAQQEPLAPGEMRVKRTESYSMEGDCPSKLMKEYERVSEGKEVHSFNLSQQYKYDNWGNPISSKKYYLSFTVKQTF